MRKILISVLVIIAILALMYSALWFALTISVSSKFNQQYANRTISTKAVGDGQEYLVSFREVTSYGFPFKLAIQIIGWREESKNALIEFNTPIRIGYDLLGQNAFISYSGEAVASYKPTSLNFGAIFKNQNAILTLNIPLSINLLKIFTQNKDLFQLVNFIKNIELRSEGTEILDLYDKKVLYNEALSIITLSFEKKKYYTDIEDFKNNIPQRLDINYAAKILASNMYKRRIPAGILLYRFAWPFTVDINSKLYIKSNNSQISEFAKDLEIGLISANFSTNILDSAISGLYKSRVEQGKFNSYTKVNSTINLKPGFSKAILDVIPFVLEDSAITVLGFKNLATELQYMDNNREKFNFTALENRHYVFDFDAYLAGHVNKQLTAQINNLSLFSNDTGLRLTSEIKLNEIFKDFDIKGLVVFNNYAKIIDIVTSYVFNFEKFTTLTDESHYVYREGIKYFLKTISDHPDSNSDDISFEYKLNSSNIKNGTIGTVEFEKVLPLYYLSLYTKAATKMRANDNPVARIKELVPDFNEHQKLLKQLMIQPFQEVDNEIWKNIIK